jgi:hypothetical protein
MDIKETAAETGKLQRIMDKIRSFFSVITIEPMLLIQGNVYAFLKLMLLTKNKY